jgi:uncharacterized Ntn-hydrolase superfamily protein
MKIKAISFILLAFILTGSITADNPGPIHPVNTYSIVCHDPETGQFGAAVQSHWFKVADVIWAEPGVGVVATQSLADFSYGPLGLQMMRYGRTAQEALEGLIASDPNFELRQVAMIDSDGNVATHTGSQAIAEAGHIIGQNYSVQANLMENSTVWQAMAEAYENSEGDLAERMMAALEAAQAEGGDIRGKQSAAMLVVSGDPTGVEWRDQLVDIRVDDSPQPLVELRRLLNITRAYNFMNEGDEHIAAGDFEKAAEAYGKASELAQGNPEILFWYAIALVTAGETDMSLPVFKQVFEMDENWRVLVPRLVKSGLLPDDNDLIELITSQ